MSGNGKEPDPAAAAVGRQGKSWALIDTHLHLDAVEFDADRAALWQEAQQLGVTRALIPAVEPTQWPTQWAKLADFPGLGHAWGIHPCYVDSAHGWAEAQAGRALSDEEAAEIGVAALAKWVATHPTVAIGEIGLDRFVATPAWSRQVVWFDAQLALAKERHLPVLVHARRAVEEVRQRLRKAGLPGGIVHAFNGSVVQAEDLIEHGFLLGFGGAITYDRAHHLRRLVTTLPLAAVALETDAPDIPPAWAHERPLRRSEPADLVRYAAVVAELRQVAVAEVAATTTSAAERLFAVQ